MDIPHRNNSAINSTYVNQNTVLSLLFVFAIWIFGNSYEILLGLSRNAD